jgi:hypothetical protein
MSDIVNASRRKLIRAGGLICMAGAAASMGAAYGEGLVEKAKKAVGMGEEEVTPPEDLMREHGVLDRVLLIYEAGIRKFAAKEDFDPDVLTQSANVIKDFIENYHEKSEETFLFPRFRKAGTLVDLVTTLQQQHDAGRRVTERILQYAPQSRQDGDGRQQVVSAKQAFIRPVPKTEGCRLLARIRRHR